MGISLDFFLSAMNNSSNICPAFTLAALGKAAWHLTSIRIRSIKSKNRLDVFQSPLFKN